jgi:glycosyltransferase involved in cell wall biosynthesis
MARLLQFPVTSPTTTGPSRERHVLYVISRYTYRTTFIVREIEELTERGWRITVVSLRRPVFAPGRTAAHLPYPVVHHGFFAVRVLIATIAALATGRRGIVEYVRLVAAAFGREPRLLARNLSVIPQACFYASMVRRLGCRHIHAHWATVATSGAMLISRLSGVPFSFTGHAWDIFCDTRLLAEKGHAARFVLTCTAFNRQHLTAAGGVSPEKVHVVYHGLHIPAPPEDRTERAQGPLELLTVGRWSEKKGFLDLIEAMALVRDARVPLRLRIIAGDGSPAYERRVREAIGSRNLWDRVRISAWLPADRIEAAMRASDLFVLPCVQPANGAMDGIPNVLIEALSVGLPVVATRLSGIPELVRHGETGLLVSERNPRELAKTLTWCATHMAGMRKLAAEGRRLVERTFDISRTISTLEELFEAAIANRSPQLESRILDWDARESAGSAGSIARDSTSEGALCPIK